MAVIKTLTIEVEGKPYQVAGDDFYTMLGIIKDIEGRKWDGDRNLWKVPGTLAEVKAILAASDLELLGDEDELLEREIQEIKHLQAWMHWYREVAVYVSDRKSQHAKSYSFNSKSRYKAASMHDAGCLTHAVSHAQKPLEKITEPEIASLKRAIALVREERPITLEQWLIHFQLSPHAVMSVFEPHVVPFGYVDLAAVPTKEFPVIGKQHLFAVYQVDVASKLGIYPGLLPDVAIQERVAPDGTLQKVVVFQLQQPGDDQ